MLDFIRRHLGKIVILAVVLVVMIFMFVLEKVGPMIEVRQESAPGYFDDGGGLVYINGHDQPSTFQRFQSWRNDHPDRFKRVVSIQVSSYWSGAIIAYSPDSTTVMHK